ncbi:MAG: hypothetical protein JW855_01800 [Gammaproteobacteria bacterium]|nr:hypothetical protein [Gammaproteobacteria bacterium]
MNKKRFFIKAIQHAKWLCFCIFFMNLIYTRSVCAENIQDPTRPPGVSGSFLQIQALILAKGKKIILVDNHYYSVGDRVSGMQIVQIHRDFVTLQTKQGLVTVPISLDIKKSSGIKK